MKRKILDENGAMILPKNREAGAWGGSPWEAANPSPNRSQLNVGAPTDHKHELTSFTREELIRNMRYLRKNSGFVREYTNTLALYSAPVSPQSIVEDHAWRTEAEQLYADRRRVADVTGRFTGDEVQSMISKSIDTDGEIFVLKVYDRATQLPRLQMIESHRVGNFGPDTNTIDGFKLDSRGKPTAIRILQDNGKSRLVPMRGVMHIFDPESPSALRGTPTLSHAINHRLDVEELLAIEKKGVKDNLEIARIIRLATGTDLDEDEVEEFLGNSGVTEAERSDPKAMMRILGGKAFALQEGENVESFNSNRPNPTFTGFIQHLDRESALGSLPYEFIINPSGINAGAVRLVIARVQRIAQKRSQIILEKFLRPDWFFVIGSAIDNGELAPIKGWNRISGGFPKQVTVDAGRNDESLRRSIEMGLITPSDAFAEQGKTFDEAMEQKAADLKSLQAIAKRHGLNPDELFKFAKAASTVGATAPSAKKPK